ncbi:MAG: thiamine-phosphate kinase, partial [Saprospiraceae bacterium]|nr:thiamine-phosphate kinase [Saprospiraceae bacterium]
IGLSNRFSVEAVEEIYNGINAACKFYGVDLVGGDTTSSRSGLVISVTAVGYTTPDKLVKRTGAQQGDIIAVTGDLGAAYLGLQILEREKQLFMDDPSIKPELEDQKYLVGRQLKPEARKDSIAMFDEMDFVPTSMIDISDGLSSDLMHIGKQSNVGALIFEDQVPMHQEAKMMALKFNLDPITCALSGGEDYELLFTASEEDLDKVRQMADVYIVGEVTPPDFGIKMQTEGKKVVELVAQGWKHFKG